MTSEEFNAGLRKLGLTGRQFASVANARYDTVRRWQRGANVPPGLATHIRRFFRKPAEVFIDLKLAKYAPRSGRPVNVPAAFERFKGNILAQEALDQAAKRPITFGA